MRALEYTRATTTEQAIATHARTEATAFLAGGTTLLDLVKLDIMQPDRVVDVHTLALNQVETLGDGRTRIGAMVTNTQLAHHPRISEQYAVLSQALLSGATTQLRNKATTAG
ncbi:FAD binding domain-containing protein, partial [Pseudomonas sp.]|uniref:FAD binding domain-containing protein n=1 Tax=Pseudomonas sp. TaxID=306 RepID=UPI002583F5BF